MLACGGLAAFTDVRQSVRPDHCINAAKRLSGNINM